MAVLDNPRHERFAQELAKGEPASTAYVKAGYKDNRQAASRLRSNVDIQSRIAELQSVGAELVAVTIESICRELDAVQGDAKTDKQHSARVSAIMGKAKICGLVTDKMAASLSGEIKFTKLVREIVDPKETDDVQR